MLLIARCKMLGCSRDEWADSFFASQTFAQFTALFLFFQVKFALFFQLLFREVCCVCCCFFFNEMHFCRFI